MDKKQLDNILARTTPYDSADYLRTEADSAAYLEAALEDGDPELIATALRNVARAQGMECLTKLAGVNQPVKGANKR